MTPAARSRTIEEHRAIIRSYPILQWFVDHTAEECKDRQKQIQLVVELGRLDCGVSISLWCVLAPVDDESNREMVTEKLKVLHPVISRFVLNAHEFYNMRDKVLSIKDDGHQMLGTLRQQVYKMCLWSKPQLEHCNMKKLEPEGTVFLVVDEAQTHFAGQMIRMLRLLSSDAANSWWCAAAELQKATEVFE